MKIESEKHRMGVHKADLCRSKFDDVNLSGSDCSFDGVNMSDWRIHSIGLAGLRVDKANLAGAAIVNARLNSATIDGIAVTDLLAYSRADHGTKSA